MDEFRSETVNAESRKEKLYRNLPLVIFSFHFISSLVFREKIVEENDYIGSDTLYVSTRLLFSRITEVRNSIEKGNIFFE